MTWYRNLEAWKAADTLAIEIYACTSSWPKAERYGLTSQIRRAAVSVATNIVEGCARKGRREFHRFARIALGSVMEVEYLMDLAVRISVAPREHGERLAPHVSRAGRLVYKLTKSLD